MLYQQERHEPIHNIDWSKDKAELVIKDIFDIHCLDGYMQDNLSR